MTTWPRRCSASNTLPGSSPVRIRRLEGGVVGVGEPVHRLQGDDGGRVRPGDGVVQDAAAADGGELVAVPDQRDPGPVSSAMVSSARAVSWSSIPASSTSSRSPGPQPGVPLSGAGLGRGSSGRRRPSATRAGGSARPPSGPRRRSRRRRPRLPSTSGSPPPADAPAAPAAPGSRAGRWSFPHPRRLRPRRAGPSPARTPTTAAWAGSIRTSPRPPQRGRAGRLLGAAGQPGDQVGLDLEHLRAR